MCIRCCSKQEDTRIAGQGNLCNKCTDEWHELYYSQSKRVRSQSKKIWGENGVWSQFMAGGQEKVTFT